MKKVKHVIIGTGVSGLSYANFIQSEDYLILEKDSEPGGYCKTITKKGFVWDYSGHFFHFRNSEIEQFLLERMSDDDTILKVNKQTKINYKNSYIDFPFQKNIHQLNKDEFIECLCDLFSKEPKKSYTDFEDMLFGKFGKGITEKFLKPYNEKLYACSLAKLDSEAMGRFFPHAEPLDIINNFKNPDNNSYNNTFTYPTRGAIQYINALLKDLDTSKIRYNTKVDAINLERKFVVSNGDKIYFDHLISSIPFNEVIKNIEPKNTENIDLSCNKVLVFNLGFNKKGKKDIHWCYYPEKRYSFYRIGYYDNITNTDKMSLYVEIGLKSDEAIDIENYKTRVIADLKKAKVITDHELIASHAVVMNPAYVHITQASNTLYENMSQLWSKSNFYSIGRYGGWKYCSIEDNIIEAKNLAEKLNQKTINNPD